MVDRWLFRRALVGRWKSIGGALANRSSSRPPTPLQGRCKHLAWDHARGCAVVLWSTAFNARPHHKQWVWPPRSHANKSPPRIAVENLLLAVANTCATATSPRLKMLKTRRLETTSSKTGRRVVDIHIGHGMHACTFTGQRLTEVFGYCGRPKVERVLTHIQRGVLCLFAFVVMLLHIAWVRRQRAGANPGGALLLDL